jgi:bisphosphoglycerate-independent phosphoglycerate mutase (AlkP superfamily)
VLEDNTKPWSGDHCIDYRLVPGVLFCNRKVAARKPRLMDIGPSVLEAFGVPVPEYMQGRSVFHGDGDTGEGGR